MKKICEDRKIAIRNIFLHFFISIGILYRMSKLFHLIVYIIFTWGYLNTRRRLKDTEWHINLLQIQINDIIKMLS